MSEDFALADTEAEMVMIGALFADNTLAARFDLQASDFSMLVLGRVWDLAKQVVPKGGFVALGPLAKEFPQEAKLFRECVDWAAVGKPDLPGIARLLSDLGARRRIIDAADALVGRLQTNDAVTEEALARFREEVSGSVRRKTSIWNNTVAERVTNDIRDPLPCYETGLAQLDHVIGGGLFAGKCYGISARKKVGKTALAGTISHNLNSRHIKHLFVAGEMSPAEIEQRNMAREFRINSVKFLTEDRHLLLDRAAQYAVTQPNCTIYEHAPGISLDELKRVVSSAKETHGSTGVILDYWQLVTGRSKGDTEEYHLRNVAQWLADECRRQKMWCIIFAQVNQDGNTRGGEGLKLAADIYFTLHREKESPWAWMEMEESRYVLYSNVGSESTPGLYLNKYGPHFVDSNDVTGVAAA